jgi:hypothetical protein
MQRNVGKQGKRNAVVRFILAKGDKDIIVAWNQDLIRVLPATSSTYVQFAQLCIRELSTDLLLD